MKLNQTCIEKMLSTHNKRQQNKNIDQLKTIEIYVMIKKIFYIKTGKKLYKFKQKTNGFVWENLFILRSTITTKE